MRFSSEAYLPESIDDALAIINEFYFDNISVVDKEGNVSGPMSNTVKNIPRLTREDISDSDYFEDDDLEQIISEDTQIWGGSRFLGISARSDEELLTFLQGFVVCLLNFPSPKTRNELLNRLSEVGGKRSVGHIKLLVERLTGETVIVQVDATNLDIGPDNISG